MKKLNISNFIGCSINLIIFFVVSILIGIVSNSIVVATILACLSTFLISLLYVCINNEINNRYYL